MTPREQLATALAFLALFLSGAVCHATTMKPSITVDPQTVQIDLFYSGTNINVRADVPTGDKAAIKLTSSPERMELKKLGKKLGVLWMGAGSIAFEKMPAVYQVLTSVPRSDLGPRKLLVENGLTYESLVPKSAPGHDQLPELVRLKEHEGFYAIDEGGLTQRHTKGHASSATDLLQGVFYLPANAPPGEYSLTLLSFRDQGTEKLGQAKLRLECVGAVRELKHLAHEHGLIYGIGASLFAIIVGFLIGILFQQRTDESH
jgi:hypothetical protein